MGFVNNFLFIDFFFDFIWRPDCLRRERQGGVTAPAAEDDAASGAEATRHVDDPVESQRIWKTNRAKQRRQNLQPLRRFNFLTDVVMLDVPGCRGDGRQSWRIKTLVGNCRLSDCFWPERL